MVLSMHVPVYVQGHDIDYGCGSPHWNKVNDCYCEIERREPWQETVLQGQPISLGIMC